MGITGKKPDYDDIDLDQFEPEAALAQLVPFRFALENNVVPVGKAGAVLLVALPRPVCEHTIDRLEKLTGMAVEASAAPVQSIKRAIKTLYGQEESPHVLYHNE